MTTKVAINGFGRIGRLVLRRLLARKGVEVVSVNDIVPPENLAYLFKFDSTHRRYAGTVSHTDDAIVIDGKSIKVFNQRDHLVTHQPHILRGRTDKSYLTGLTDLGKMGILR